MGLGFSQLVHITLADTKKQVIGTCPNATTGQYIYIHIYIYIYLSICMYIYIYIYIYIHTHTQVIGTCCNATTSQLRSSSTHECMHVCN